MVCVPAQNMYPRGEFTLNDRKHNCFPLLSVMAAAVCLIILTAVCRYPKGMVNYKNSDATWHVLYTMQCYDEVPVSEHKFAPLVTLGDESDKGLQWGACVPDRNDRNYYYTSFSGAGFLAPYIFMKLFGLTGSEQTLYLFNTVLFSISAMILIRFLWDVFRESRFRIWVVSAGSLAYLFSPELLHNFGVVYWCHSLMQCTLLLQGYAYYRHRSQGKGKSLFLLLCLVNPYIEWTGYVANGGFFLAELFRYWKTDKVKALKNSAAIAAATVGALLLFLMHFLLVVPPDALLEAMKARFLARNLSAHVPLSALLTGYLSSFRYTFALVAGLAVFAGVLWGGAKAAKQNAQHYTCAVQPWLLFVFCFPVLENVLMIQHAVEYAFDRMKLIFPVVLILCELVNYILLRISKAKWPVIVLAVAAMGCNLFSYMNDPSWVMNADYRADNQILAEYASRFEEDSVMGCERPVRGYLNILFSRGIKEKCKMDALMEYAQEKDVRYAIEIETDAALNYNMYRIEGLEIYDRQQECRQYITVENGRIQVTELAAQIP